MYKIRKFPESNYKAIYFNGQTLRSNLDVKKPILELEYPEFYDVKITNYCSGGCKYCYQDSKKEKHYPDIVKKFNAYFGKMTDTQKPFQIACLEENEYIFGKDGGKKIKDLIIGDLLFDENGNCVKIINIIKSKKDTIKLKGNKGLEIICTKDHPFIINNKKVEAKDLIGKELSIGNYIGNKNTILNIESFINKDTRIIGKKGGSSGGKVIGDNCRIMHTLPFIKKEYLLDNDIMWLYGISVAEGSKKGLALHQKEIEYANKAFLIYNKMFGLNGTIYKNKNTKGMCIEFNKPKIYSTFFFDAMEIGYGAKNKSIKFLFGLNKELIRNALIGMFDGDGHYKKRLINGKYYGFSVEYGTVSETLANELTYLLSVVFSVQSRTVKQIVPERQINGRILKESYVYKIAIEGKNNLEKLFPNLFINDNDYQNIGKSKYSCLKTNNIKIKEIENIGKRDVYDITLENGSSHLFQIKYGIVNHNCGGGNPNEHPEFCDLLEASFNQGITPNYTTNGIGLTDKVIEYTKKYAGGVAISCHEHLDKIWAHAVNKLNDNGIKVNLHIIISDKKSIDRFIKIYKEFKDKIDYIVLLPLTEKGRAKDVPNIEYEYLVKIIKENGADEKIAFGANFFPYLRNKNEFKLSIYEPEIMSKYIDFKDNGYMYKSSFSDNIIKQDFLLN